MASGPQETLGLTLTADTSQWDTAFAKAAAGAKAVGNEVSSLADAFDSFIEKGPGNLGKILGDVRDVAKGVGQELTGNLFGSVGNLGKLLGEAKTHGLGLGTALKGVVTGLGAIGLAQAGIGALVQFAEASMEAAHFTAELANLRANVPTEALQAMNEAMDGSVSEIELLRFGMKALNSEANISVEGLGVLTKAADTLSDRGFGDALEIARQFQFVLETGNTRVLKQYGIRIKETGDKQRDLNAAMVEFARVGSLPVNVNPGLVAIEALQKKTRDWQNDMKAGWGEIVTQAILAFDKISDGLAGIQDPAEANVMERRRAAAGIGGGGLFASAAGLGFAGGDIEAEIAAERRRLAGIARAHEIQNLPLQGAAQLDAMMRASSGALAGEGMGWGRLIAGRGRPGDFDAQLLLARARDWWDKNKRKPSRGGRRRELSDSFLGGDAGAFQDYFGMGANALDRGLTSGISAFGDFQSGGQGLGMLAFEGAASQDGGLEGLAGQFFGGASGGLEEAAGRAEQMQKLLADLNDSASALGGAYATVSSGLMGTVEAAIAGNESMGKAALRRIQMEMAAEAKLHAAKAIAAGAAALGALAIGNPGAAAFFGKQAAQEAAAAAAFGLGAAVIPGGGGGGYSNPSSSAGGGGYVGGQSQQGGPQNITINWYGGVVGGSEAAVGQEIVRLVDKGRSSGLARSEVNTGVTYE